MTRFQQSTSFAFLTLSVLLTGCADFTVPAIFRPPAALQNPAVTIEQVVIQEMTDEGVKLGIVLRLVNPNDIALPLRDAQYTFSIPDLGQYTGRVNPNATIPSLNDLVLTLPAAIAFTDGRPTSALQYKLTGHLTYEPPGDVRELLTEMGLFLPQVSLDAEGSIQSPPPAPAPM